MHRFVRLPAILLCVAMLGLAPIASRSAGASSYSPSTEECRFLSQINTYRAQNHLGKLKLSVPLGAAGRHHSNDMASNSLLSHTLSNGTSAHQNIINYGYSSTAWWGENIYAGYGMGSNGIDNASAAGAFTWWKHSPGHNANMLSTHFTVIGIARSYNANSTYKWYWTTDFGGFTGATVSCG